MSKWLPYLLTPLVTLAGCQSAPPPATNPSIEDKSRPITPHTAPVRYYQGGVQEGVPTQMEAPTPTPTPTPISEPIRLPSAPAQIPETQLQPTTSNLPITAEVLTPIPSAPQISAQIRDRYAFVDPQASDYPQRIQALEQENFRLRLELDNLRQFTRSRWGDQLLATQTKQLVKYTDAYQSRGTLDFEAGRVRVETLKNSGALERLQTAIVTTLLTPFDADNPHLFDTQNIQYSGPAILAGQIRDHEGVPVEWEWRAKRFAQWLVQNKLQEIQANGRTYYRVDLPLVDNHVQVRGHKYETLVRKYAQQYRIGEPLIYAIMETESSFNPYATSVIPAYGLMQIVPATAGRDVFQRLKGRSDQPTRSYLFNPANNIDAGTAYLHILQTTYLKDIQHPLSREYCMISAYNGGAGNVLKTFHSDRQQAVKVINSLSPQEVYQRLNTRHPSAESRRYIEKVTQAKQRYLASAQG